MNPLNELYIRTLINPPTPYFFSYADKTGSRSPTGDDGKSYGNAVIGVLASTGAVLLLIGLLALTKRLKANCKTDPFLLANKDFGTWIFHPCFQF